VLHKDKAGIDHEKEHMKEHQQHIDTSNMSEQELQFHYFKMHDSDGNNKLDGLELVKSLIHWHDEVKLDVYLVFEKLICRPITTRSLDVLPLKPRFLLMKS